MMTAVSQSFRLSCITLTVVVLIPAAGPPFARPLDRVFGILIGAAASVGVSAVFRGRYG
jgi:xanthine/uracil permease